MNDKNARQLVSRVVVTHKDKVLMLRRSETDSRSGFWEFPGGAVDPGESFEEGAIRETQEEAGITLDDLTFEHSESYEVNGTKRIAAVFRSEVQNTAVTLSEEHDDFTWVDVNSFSALKLEDPYREYLEKYYEVDEATDSEAGDSGQSMGQTGNRKKLIAYTDGGSRGNPGPSASGYVIMDEDKQILSEGGEYLGITTNNQAEYQAVKRALEVCIELGASDVDFYIDSQLVVKQMSGEYKIKNRDLWPIHESIKELATQLNSVTYTHVYREDNKLADAKVNEVLDARQK